MKDYIIKALPTESGSKLFLCTRLLSVGDKLKECNVDNIEREIDHFETVLPLGIWVFTDEAFIHSSQAWKKVDVDISPNVKWLKDGDEFDEADIQWGICNTITNKVAYFKKSLNLPDYCKAIIMFKCPMCETYH